MRKSLILFLGTVFLLPLLLTGCGKTITEKAIEKSTGGDVDIKNDKVKIENDLGTWETGKDVSLPDNWPEDVYVPDGNIVTVSNTDFGQGVTVEVDGSVVDLEETYKNKIEEQGWNVNMSFALEDNAMLGAEKDQRTLSVNIADNEGQTTIIISVNKKISN